MQTIFKSPTKLPKITQPIIFLAGSIEMGVAEDWQTRITKALEDLDVCILNPRRDAWDDSWEQKIENEQFREQVEWELDGQERADLIAMFFDPNTKSPITLLELGLFARTQKVIVFCEEGFWRKGNIDIVCERYGIPRFATEEEFITEIRMRRKKNFLP